MKIIKLAHKMFMLNLIFCIIYNTYFGCNRTPINSYEESCDHIFHIVLKVAFVIYLIPLVRLYEKSIEKSEKE